MLIDENDYPETPLVLIEEEIVLRNIRRYQEYCDRHGLKLRPHIKTHKLHRFALEQIRQGATGITCQKISEAEAMARAYREDILITYNIVGEAKLKRLKELARIVTRLSVTADSKEVITGLGQTFAGEKKTLSVLVECDTGAGRCGVQNPESALQLAKEILKYPGLTFAGLMTYPANGGGDKVADFMREAVALLKREGIDCPVISGGNSPDMWSAAEVKGVTEVRPGTYIYNDRSLIERGTCQESDCALTVLSTVVSRPVPHRAVIDAGSKILTNDLFGLKNYGRVLNSPDLQVTGLSEEHGIITDVTGKTLDLKIGQKVRIIPNHCCVVSNMVDQVHIREKSGKINPEPLAARGAVT